MAILSTIFPILLVTMMSSQLVHSSGIDDRRRLMNDLLRHYNPLIRPVTVENQSLQVNFSLTLSQIISLDEVNQMMKTNVWLKIYWIDYQLKWNKEKYGNVSSLSIPSEAIWVPDIVLFNNADGNFEVSYKSKCVVYDSGFVMFIPPSIYQSSCSIDVEYFPFDQQVCEMKFASWTYKDNELEYSFYEDVDILDVNSYLKSGTWDLLNGTGKVHMKEADKEERSMIVFTITLRRKSLFYIVNLIVPCILISFLSIFVFALPAGSTKIGLTINVLVSLIVFLLIISAILPPSLSIPLLGKFLIFNFLMSLFAIFISVIIINITSRSAATHYSMPLWVRVIFLRELPKYLLITRPNHDERWQKKSPVDYDSLSQSSDADSNSEDIAAQAIRFRDRNRTGCQAVTSSDVDVNKSRPENDTQRTAQFLFHQPPRHYLDLSIRMFRSIRDVNFISQRIQKKDDFDEVRDDWKYVARVIDRLLLIIFLIVTIFGTAGILLNSPHVLDTVDQDDIINQLKNYSDTKKQSYIN